MSSKFVSRHKEVEIAATAKIVLLRTTNKCVAFPASKKVEFHSLLSRGRARVCISDALIAWLQPQSKLHRARFLRTKIIL